MNVLRFNGPHIPDDWLQRQYAQRERCDTSFAFVVSLSVAFALGVFVGTFFL